MWMKTVLWKVFFWRGSFYALGVNEDADAIWMEWHEWRREKLWLTRSKPTCRSVLFEDVRRTLCVTSRIEAYAPLKFDEDDIEHLCSWLEKRIFVERLLRFGLVRPPRWAGYRGKIEKFPTFWCLSRFSHNSRFDRIFSRFFEISVNHSTFSRFFRGCDFLVFGFEIGRIYSTCEAFLSFFEAPNFPDFKKSRQKFPKTVFSPFFRL